MGDEGEYKMDMGKYVVIDLEMCNVPKNRRTPEYPWAAETIQIGAVLVDDLKIVDEFNTYVCPQFGQIDRFIQRLTGITKNDVKDAVTMQQALKALFEWAPEDSIFVSWSDTDLYQIQHELEGKKICIPREQDIFESWIDCQLTFSEKMHEPHRKYNLKEALIAADICFDENIHNGLVDARNTGELFIKMEKEPELVLNKYYRYAKTGVSAEPEEKATLGDLFPWLATMCATA